MVIYFPYPYEPCVLCTIAINLNKGESIFSLQKKTRKDIATRDKRAARLFCATDWSLNVPSMGLHKPQTITENKRSIGHLLFNCGLPHSQVLSGNQRTAAFDQTAMIQTTHFGTKH